MNCYKADLHIHTVLSPCGDLEMSPANIIAKSKEQGLQIIGITDHNSTLHCRLAKKLGAKEGIFVLCGAEVTSKEEAHCLCFFENDTELDLFQQWLDEKIAKIPLDEERFGYQLAVNEYEEIIYQPPYLLTSAIDADIDEIYAKVHSLNGLFIPAHVNRPANSLMSQLGFVPPDLKADGLEISKHITKENFLKKNAYLKRFAFIQSSDAHYIHLIGETFCMFYLNEPSFAEISMALANENGRHIKMTPD
ncbi:MAG: PHP domain-containing protein [Bacteroidales bacterium]|jgi:PHP family Zn ribbon phosphoesterase|nr:PHP domain-containing protein [Bacteroidales bacterium]